MNGSKEERHLMNALDALEWTGVRSPASGSAPRAQPDILAAKGGVTLVGEAKAGKRPHNIGDDELAALQVVGDAFAAATVAIARFKGDRTFYLAPVENCDRTDAGNLSIPGAPERFPWEVGIEFSPPTDAIPTYQATVITNDETRGAPAGDGDDYLQTWAASVAFDQLTSRDDEDADQHADAAADREGRQR